jgi:hypothetical protein
MIEESKNEDENVEVNLDEEKETESKKEPDAVEEKEEEVSQEVDTAEEDKPKKPNKFQKRIDDLTRKQREAERQRDEYYNVAVKTMDENKKLRDRASKIGKFGTDEMEARIKSEIESATSAYKSAYEEGDADKIVEAQTRMIDAATQRGKLAEMKQANDQSVAPTAPDPSIPPPPNARAVEWAEQNPWFNKDMVMTNAAYTIHDELIKRGISGDSDAYYEQLNDRIRQEFPHKFSSDEIVTDQKSSQNVNQTVVTPAGNQSPRKSRKVKLSPSQVAVAKRLGVPLEEYAKQFVALNN